MFTFTKNQILWQRLQLAIVLSFLALSLLMKEALLNIYFICLSTSLISAFLSFNHYLQYWPHRLFSLLYLVYLFDIFPFSPLLLIPFVLIEAFLFLSLSLEKERQDEMKELAQAVKSEKEQRLRWRLAYNHALTLCHQSKEKERLSQERANELTSELASRSLLYQTNCHKLQLALDQAKDQAKKIIQHQVIFNPSDKASPSPPPQISLPQAEEMASLKINFQQQLAAVEEKRARLLSQLDFSQRKALSLEMQLAQLKKEREEFKEALKQAQEMHLQKASLQADLEAKFQEKLQAIELERQKESAALKEQLEAAFRQVQELQLQKTDLRAELEAELKAKFAAEYAKKFEEKLQAIEQERQKESAALKEHLKDAFKQMQELQLQKELEQKELGQDKSTQLSQALKREKGMYKQLKEQFYEKSALLDAARQTLFQLGEQTQVLNRQLNDEEPWHQLASSYEQLLAQTVAHWEKALSDARLENEQLDHIIFTLSQKLQELQDEDILDKKTLLLSI